ncbi:hypothetical protein GCK72_006917 [Caenorhabditis remanei]|uniref:Uncharacterized protein n=1 Tax=Caenorhabditis remanei TaxID=31234 RepID=A0A6A5HHV1_CAERE|nr:hypothetical protein GCK72_006917 [Caenorhabditis remanei]KAF1766959.1 hypothetical protein GCK72_006917 [Caenorhabditis remanei]
MHYPFVNNPHEYVCIHVAFHILIPGQFLITLISNTCFGAMGSQKGDGSKDVGHRHAVIREKLRLLREGSDCAHQRSLERQAEALGRIHTQIRELHQETVEIVRIVSKVDAAIKEWAAGKNNK